MVSLGERRAGAFDPGMWKQRAGGGYEKLGWVGAQGLQGKMLEVCDLHGDEVVVDVGTGSGEIAGLLSPKAGRVYAFDYSAEMLSRANGNLSRANVEVVRGSAEALFFPSESVDLVTARMVYHHLTDEQITRALGESFRVLKPGGKLVVNEYVAVDDEVRAFEREVFDVKEKGRHLWTGEELGSLVAERLGGDGVEVDYGVMPQYSVRDWMGKSGLSPTIQDEVLGLYVDSPEGVRDKMGITITGDGDALVDRLFVFVVAEKHD